jgi:phenylacetate-CoA ligase
MKWHWSGKLRLNLIDLIRETSILDTLNELRKQQYYDKNIIDKIAEDKFQELTNIAQNTTDYYSNDFDYKKLKQIDKKIIRSNINSFISKSYKKKLIKKATGGSTGAPLLYYTTTESISYLWAGIMLSWEVAGYNIGDKVAFLAGTSIIKSDLKHDIFYKLMNIDVYSTYKLDENTVIKYIEKIRRSKAKIIYGYATAIAFAAEIMKKNKISPPYKLKGIVSTAEVLTDENRKLIEDAFNVKVYNQYGCNEAGVSAFECEHGKMHIISTRCKYEVDDEGNLISTDLSNKGFIMLKYFTGDQIELSNSNECMCKRNYPIIENIRGRSYDMIIDSKKHMMHAAFFNIMFKNDNTIKQFQVRFSKHKISLYLDTDKSKTSINDYQHYIEAVKKYMFFYEYEIILNADLIRSNSMKHRYVINTEL